MSTAIVWFRRDLRLHDHPPLHAALAGHDRVVALFVLDPALLHGRFRSPGRSAFLAGCLRALDAELRARGGRLVLRTGRPADVVPAVAREAGADAVHWASDVSPYAMSRDRAVRAALDAAGVRACPAAGNFVADVSVPRTKGGKPYTVFTPFWRVWEELERRTVHRAPREVPCAELVGDPLDALADIESGLPSEPACTPGEGAARDALARFVRGPIADYDALHDTLAGGTSMLSPYLRFGCISPRETEQRARDAGGPGAEAFVRQLAWRDFYAHVLLCHPGNARHEHQARYRGLRWEHDQELLDAWRAGATGYPLVDAGMRQLAATGWMHNRARLVVGSFLTKDLHLDWRAGEAHFMEHLLDGDVANNNGNWQWIASVGVDPAPYFRRILSPSRQQERFDPGGTYVRRWVPELKDVPAEHLAEPWRMSAAEQEACGCVIGRDYPEPVVDHGIEREVALARYRETADA